MSTSNPNQRSDYLHDHQRPPSPSQSRFHLFRPHAPHRIAPTATALHDLTLNLRNETLKTTTAAKTVLTDFKRFLDRGNVVDMAVGIVMGTAFTSIVQSLVNDMFMPFVSLAAPSTQLANQFIVLRCPIAPGGAEKPCNKTTYLTPVDAKNAGAVTWNWGQFVQTVINFIIIAIAVYFIVRAYAHAFRRDAKDKQPTTPTTKPCSLCTKDIPIKAIRCPECCADIPNDPNDYPDVSTVDMSEPSRTVPLRKQHA